MTAVADLQSGLAAMTASNVTIHEDAQLDAHAIAIDLSGHSNSRGGDTSSLAGDSFAIARTGEDSLGRK